jgi:hypothetical protein
MIEKIVKMLERIGEIFEEFLVLRLEGKDIRSRKGGSEPQLNKSNEPEMFLLGKPQKTKTRKGPIK